MQGYNVCVRLKIFMNFELPLCLSPGVWRQLLEGELIYVNPASGALVVNLLPLAGISLPGL